MSDIPKKHPCLASTKKYFTLIFLHFSLPYLKNSSLITTFEKQYGYWMLSRISRHQTFFLRIHNYSRSSGLSLGRLIYLFLSENQRFSTKYYEKAIFHFLYLLIFFPAQHYYCTNNKLCRQCQYAFATIFEHRKR